MTILSILVALAPVDGSILSLFKVFCVLIRVCLTTHWVKITSRTRAQKRKVLAITVAGTTLLDDYNEHILGVTILLC